MSFEIYTRTVEHCSAMERKEQLIHWTSQEAQMVKSPLVETRVQSLGQEDPLEKEMATHSSILAWRVPWTEEPGRLQSIGLQRIRHGVGN